MLVLTRKSNQSIMIGDEIEVSVLSIMGEKVRIGIQAPRSIPVFRKEVGAAHAQTDGAGKLFCRHAGAVVFERDARVNGPAVEMLELVQARKDVVFDGFRERYVVSG